MNAKFVIYSAQRSGSSYLMKAMDDHPQAICAGEIFKKSKNDRQKYPLLNFDYAAKKKSRLFKWLPNRVIRKHLHKVYTYDEADARGFRLMVNQARDFPAIVKQCSRLGVKPIIIIRRNIVRQAISLTIAQNAGLWIDPSSDNNTDHKQIEIDIQRFSKNINYFQHCRSELENTKFGIEPLIIYFEDLAGSDVNNIVRSAYQYVGVLGEYHSKISKMKKSIYHLEERIVNYEEVLSVIRAKGLEEFIIRD